VANQDGLSNSKKDLELSTARGALWCHWPNYMMEAAELALFMMSACGLSVLLFHPQSPVTLRLPDELIRRALMGIAMAATAVLIIHSPFGKKSGAHFNPAVTLASFWLGQDSRLGCSFLRYLSVSGRNHGRIHVCMVIWASPF
jgi:glycerol uptake facilitator-like aquaporin